MTNEAANRQDLQEQGPLLEQMIIPKNLEKFLSYVSMIDRGLYAALFRLDGGRVSRIIDNGETVKLVKENQDPFICSRTQRKAIQCKEGSIECSKELNSYIYDLLCDRIDSVLVELPCEQMSLHLLFKIQYLDGCHESHNRTVAVLFLGPFANPDCDEDSLDEKEVQVYRTLPRFSPSQKELLERVCGALARKIGDEYGRAAQRKKVWVAMDFGTSFNNMSDSIRDVLRELEYTPIRADELKSSQTINEDVRDGIDGCAFFIADDSGANPNVLWEIGLADALSKPTILITRDIRTAPFSTKERRHITYQQDNLASLRSQIRVWVKEWQQQGLVADPLSDLRLGRMQDKEVNIVNEGIT